MSIFSKVFQKLLSETDEILQKEREERLRSMENRLEKNINLNFKNYAIKPDYGYIEEEYEEDSSDDDANYRDKNKEMEKQAKIDYINKVKEQAIKKIEDLKKQGFKNNNDSYGAKTIERNLNREVGGMEINYDLVDKIEQIKGQVKKKNHKKFSFRMQAKINTFKSMRSLASFGLGILKKRMKLIEVKKMFSSLLTKSQIKVIVSDRNINVKKLKEARAKIVMITKKIKKQIKTTSRDKSFNKSFNQKTILQKEKQIIL